MDPEIQDTEKEVESMALSEADIQTIKVLWASGNYSLRELARNYNTYHEAILEIVDPARHQKRLAQHRAYMKTNKGREACQRYDAKRGSQGDPLKRQHKNERVNLRKAELRKNAEWVQKEKARKKVYYDSVKNDPEYKAKRRENLRAWRAKKRLALL